MHQKRLVIRELTASWCVYTVCIVAMANAMEEAVCLKASSKAFTPKRPHALSSKNCVKVSSEHVVHAYVAFIVAFYIVFFSSGGTRSADC